MKKMILLTVLLYAVISLYAETDIDKTKYKETTVVGYIDIRLNAKENQYLKIMDTKIYKAFINDREFQYALEDINNNEIVFYTGIDYPVNSDDLVNLYFFYNVLSGKRDLEYIELNTRLEFKTGEGYKVSDNLQLRENEGRSSRTITTMQSGTEVTVLETGKQEKIDGITSRWVKVRLNVGTEGWCFGGYLTKIGIPVSNWIKY